MRFVKIKHNNKIFPAYYLVVDENFVWPSEQIELEKAKGRAYCEMAFLDHGQPSIPMDAIPNISEYVPGYLTPTKRNHISCGRRWAVYDFSAGYGNG